MLRDTCLLDNPRSSLGQAWFFGTGRLLSSISSTFGWAATGTAFRHFSTHRLCKDPAKGGKTQGLNRLEQGRNHHQAGQQTGYAHIERQSTSRQKATLEFATVRRPGPECRSLMACMIMLAPATASAANVTLDRLSSDWPDASTTGAANMTRPIVSGTNM